MTDKRFRVVNHLLATKEWDFFIFHEIGPDRIHHGFWSYFDEEHPRHEPGNPYQHAIRDYYIDLDIKIGEILAKLDEDTVVFVVSDHGGKRMLGGICLNEWLIQNGYMTLKERPARPTPIEKAQVDWTRTAAWGFGGYYGRLFLNVKGREPHGVIPAEDYEKVRDQLIAQLSAIPDHRGLPLKTRVYKPQDVYQECKNIPPDLIIYFGDLDWRAVGQIGGDSLYVFENDTGPDDANHSEHGIFVMWDPRRRIGQRLSGLQLMDVAPTILKTFGMEPPADMQGRLVQVEGGDTAYSDEEEEKVRARLEALGYLG
jgi:predicted AlkP superfamily phosphohydrolase/phosphomutase